MSVLRNSLLVVLAALAGWGAGCKTTADEQGVKMGVETGKDIGTEPADQQVAVAPERKIETREKHWPSGKPSERVEGYVDEEGEFIPHGVSTMWFEDGQIRIERHFIDGLPDGPRTTWYQNGQMWAQGYYRAGREHGTWTAWWPNGFKQREWHMDDGAFHGTFTEWHQNGEKKLEFEYVHGLKQGPMIVWDESGTEVRRIEYVDDREQP